VGAARGRDRGTRTPPATAWAERDCPSRATTSSSTHFEVDYTWPGLIVEIDGPGHRRACTRVDDRIEDAALRAAGFTVLRFTERDVDFRPDAVLEALGRFLRR
jgi:hypothetical protein